MRHDSEKNTFTLYPIRDISFLSFTHVVFQNVTTFSSSSFTLLLTIFIEKKYILTTLKQLLFFYDHPCIIQYNMDIIYKHILLTIIYMTRDVSATLYGSSDYLDYSNLKNFIETKLEGQVTVDRSSRIVGGRRWMLPLPFLAAIRLTSANNYHYCGGVVIDRYFVLTAAHCVQE